MYWDERSWYDVAEICLNGHVISEFAVSQPERHQEFCRSCGAKTIQNCLNCNTAIRGYYHIPGVIGRPPSHIPPAYCHECGHPYPWTEARLSAAKALVIETESLSAEEQKQFIESIPDIIADTPRTTLAATRFKKYLGKVGEAVGGALRDLFIDIVSETAKKIIWPNG